MKPMMALTNTTPKMMEASTLAQPRRNGRGGSQYINQRLVRKLSSYARQNQTKKALWELDHVRQTIHILDFIDDLELRQSVQKALNRGEAYHRMRRAVSYVNAGKFRVKTEA